MILTDEERAEIWVATMIEHKKAGVIAEYARRIERKAREVVQLEYDQMSDGAIKLQERAEAAEQDAKHVRQANANYREENRLAIERAEAAEQQLQDLKGKIALRSANCILNSDMKCDALKEAEQRTAEAVRKFVPALEDEIGAHKFTHIQLADERAAREEAEIVNVGLENWIKIYKSRNEDKMQWVDKATQEHDRAEAAEQHTAEAVRKCEEIAKAHPDRLESVGKHGSGMFKPGSNVAERKARGEAERRVHDLQVILNFRESL